MKKYNVRFYLHTFVDFEVEAETAEDAEEIANNLEYDMDQLLDNMVPCEDVDIYEIKGFIAKGIHWDIDKDEDDLDGIPELPSTETVYTDDEDKVVDILSDMYGYCINSIDEIVKNC